MHEFQIQSTKQTCATNVYVEVNARCLVCRLKENRWGSDEKASIGKRSKVKCYVISLSPVQERWVGEVKRKQRKKVLRFAIPFVCDSMRACHW